MDARRICVLACALLALVAIPLLFDAPDVRPAGPSPEAGPHRAETPVLDVPEPTHREAVEATRDVVLRGRVVDLDDEPVADAILSFVTLFAPIQTLRAESGSDGRFAVTGQPAPAEFSVQIAKSSGCAISRPDDYVLAQIPSDEEIVVRVRRYPKLRGTVHDSDGEPSVGAVVTVWRSGAPIGRARTIDDGSFVAITQHTSHLPVYVSAVSADETRGLRKTGPWEFHDSVALALPEARAVTLDVVDGSTGTPVEGYAVRVRPTGSRARDIDAPRSPGPHERGRVTIGGLWAGDSFVQVVPDSVSLSPSEVMRVDPDTVGDRVLSVRLERRAPLRVRVAWESGRPAAGLRVLLVRTRARRLGRHISDPAQGRIQPMARWQLHVPTMVSSATTDEEGIASLGRPHDLERFVVRVVVEAARWKDTRFEHPVQYVSVQLRDETPDAKGIAGGTRVFPSPDSGVELPVPEPGRIEGRVTINGQPARGAVGMYPQSLFGRGRRAQLDEAGNFAFADVGAGTWFLRVEPGFGRELPLWNPKRGTRVRSGETTRAALDFTPRRVVFRVQDAYGRPVTNRRLVAGMGTVAQWVETDARGFATVEHVPLVGWLSLWRSPARKKRIARVNLSPEQTDYLVDATLE